MVHRIGRGGHRRPHTTKESGTPVAHLHDVGPLYIEHNPLGAQLTFSSPASDPSCLTVPLREK
ncbi:hypothetical protein [Streptomyces sp. NPDC056682]|uniref:hypothetical protein n=1 Tax=Streptomyces sp. NPDC056682 TaxID=3345909 RepID=UPI0036C28BE1